VVVYWDQGGAGRSFDPNSDPRELSIAEHLADLDGVVNHLCQEFNDAKVIL